MHKEIWEGYVECLTAAGVGGAAGATVCVAGCLGTGPAYFACVGGCLSAVGITTAVLGACCTVGAVGAEAGGVIGCWWGACW